MSQNICKETAALMHLEPYASKPPGLKFMQFSDDELREAISKNISAITTTNSTMIDSCLDDDLGGLDDDLNNLTSQVRGLQCMVAIAKVRGMSLYS